MLILWLDDRVQIVTRVYRMQAWVILNARRVRVLLLDEHGDQLTATQGIL